MPAAKKKKSSRRPARHIAAQLPMPGIANSRAAFALAATATAAELFPVTALNDAQLRNIQATRDSSGAPWFPKPALGRWDTVATLAGLRRHLSARADRADRLPTYPSMESCEARAHIPKPCQQFLKARGSTAFHTNGTVALDPLLAHLQPLLEKIFSGDGAQIKSIEGLESLDKDFQAARLSRERADSLQFDNKVKAGILAPKNEIDELIWEKQLSPLRAELLNFSKLHAAQANPANPALAQRILDAGIARILSLLREHVPARIPEEVAA